MNNEVMVRRIKGVDICRSVAILLAMWSHVLVTFGAHWEGPSYAWVRFAMQMAPVAFICLFGAMLEISYARKFREGNVENAVCRMYVRAAQCYVLYAITVIALFIAGRYSVGYSLRTILMIGITPFTDILKFYALAIIIAPVLISIRLKWGLWPLVLAFIMIQMAHPLLEIVRYTSVEGKKDYIGPIIGFLYGGSNADVGAPSLIHGIALVCIGIVLGVATNAIFSAESQKRRAGWTWFAAIWAVSLVVSIFFWAETTDVLQKIVTLKIRNENHPFYYALGLFATTTFLLICIVLFDIIGFTFANKIRFIGTVSLFTFCFGNVLLYLQPFGPPAEDKWGPTLLYAAAIPIQSWIFLKLATVKNPQTFSVAGVVQSIMRIANKHLDSVTKPAAKYVASKVSR